MRWSADFPRVEPADVIVEGFGVALPDIFLEAMAARRPAPVWINLEYLSAEPWVDSHHGLPSPHPRLPLTKYFFFPGFTATTGGVLIEDGLIAARDAFQADEAARQELRRMLGIEPGARGGTWVSLFCYDNAALPGLVSAWAADPHGINCVVPAGLALAQLARIAGRTLAPGTRAQIGGLNIFAVPFLDLDQYDRLLWSCDLNFVRGEDSYVRAQLAARPLVWQAYPQEEDAHLKKTAAFVERYCEGLAPPDAQVCAALFNAWNLQALNCGDVWPGYRGRLRQYSARALEWAHRLAENGDLAVNLAKFCEDRLK